VKARPAYTMAFQISIMAATSSSRYGRVTRIVNPSSALIATAPFSIP